MSNWGNALLSGIGAAAKSGADSIDQMQKQQAAIDAEQRAADLKLEMSERLAAAEELRKTAGARRFADITKAKMGEEIPVAAADIDETGITRESAKASGLETGFAKDSGQLSALESRAAEILADPKRSAEEKADAQGLLDQLAKQKAGQGMLNAKAVEGKTRRRSFAEARDAAFEDAAVNDVDAFIGGTAMWDKPLAAERDAKKLGAESNEKKADRESRERIEGLRSDTRRDIAEAETARKSEADKQRAEAAKAKAEALAGGKGAKATALMQNYEYLSAKLGPDVAQKVLFQSKDSSEAEKVFKLVEKDEYGSKTVEEHLADVRKIGAATGGGTKTQQRLKYLPNGDIK